MGLKLGLVETVMVGVSDWGIHYAHESSHEYSRCKDVCVIIHYMHSEDQNTNFTSNVRDLVLVSGLRLW